MFVLARSHLRKIPYATLTSIISDAPHHTWFINRPLQLKQNFTCGSTVPSCEECSYHWAKAEKLARGLRLRSGRHAVRCWGRAALCSRTHADAKTWTHRYRRRRWEPRRCCNPAWHRNWAARHSHRMLRSRRTRPKIERNDNNEYKPGLRSSCEN